MTPREESVLAKLVSLIVKVGALLVIFFMPTQFALDLQLLGGVWMVADLPGGDPGPVHPLVQRSGAAGRLGRRHDRRHVAVLGRKGLDAAARPEVGRAAAQANFDLGFSRLQRSDLGDHQFRRRGRALARPAPDTRATKPRRAITRTVDRLSPRLLSARSRYKALEIGRHSRRRGSNREYSETSKIRTSEPAGTGFASRSRHGLRDSTLY